MVGASVTFPVVAEVCTAEYTGDDPLAFVVSGNLLRRHLSESQRGMVASKLANLNLGDNQHKEGAPIGGPSISRAKAAEMLNVGQGTVDRARSVIKKGVPELSAAVESGEITVNAASEIAKLPAARQLEVLAEGPEAVKEKAKEEAVMLWMLDNQGGRRNLADIDKISIARKKEVILAAQAKERQLSGLRQNQDTVMSKSTERSEPILTREEAAKEAGVGKTKYDEGKVILDAVASGESPKELLEQVRAGEVSVHKAAVEPILTGQDSVLSVSTEQNKTGPRLSTGAGPMADNTTQNEDETEPSEPTI